MLNAHMDEVGLYVTRITKEGYLHIGKAGSIDDRLLLGKKVLVGKDRLPGVTAIKAVHLSTREETTTTVIKVDDIVVDVGAKSDKELAGKAAVGDQITFDTTFGTFGDGYLVGKAFDDRVGCAIVAELLKMDWPFSVIGMFSAQEEVGTKGAMVGAWRYPPDISITVEGTIAADIGEVKDYQEVIDPGCRASPHHQGRRHDHGPPAPQPADRGRERQMDSPGSSSACRQAAQTLAASSSRSRVSGRWQSRSPPATSTLLYRLSRPATTRTRCRFFRSSWHNLPPRRHK